jgi:hypothetical protein
LDWEVPQFLEFYDHDGILMAALLTLFNGKLGKFLEIEKSADTEISYARCSYRFLTM